MKVRWQLVALLLAGLGFRMIPAFGQEAEKNAAELPHVLILGDSISMGYAPFLRQSLASEAVVTRPRMDDGSQENCEGTTHGLGRLAEWLRIDGGDWEVIHFNFGLHDMKRIDPSTGRNSNRATDPPQASLAVYEEQLRKIVEALKATDAALIFATTTPVPEGGVRPHRDPADPERYNEIARKIMRENDIAVNDLYSFAAPRLAEIQLPVNVHFNEMGSKALAGEVANAIREALGSKRVPR